MAGWRVIFPMRQVRRDARPMRGDARPVLGRANAAPGGAAGGAIFAAVAALLLAAAAGVAPARLADARLKRDAAGMAARAAELDQDAVVAGILESAAEHGIPEAAAPGAVAVSRLAGGGRGVCAVRLSYSRKIRLYGFIPVRLRTDAEIVRQFWSADAEPGTQREMDGGGEQGGE